MKKMILTVLVILAISVPASIAWGGSYSAAVNALGPIDYWRLGETSIGTAAANEGTTGPAGTYGASVDPTAAGPRPSDTVGGLAMIGFDSDNTGAGFISNATWNDPNTGVDMGVYAPVLGGDARTILAWVKPSAHPPGNPNWDSVIVYYGTPSHEEMFLYSIGETGNPSLDIAHHGSRTTASTPVGE